MMLVRCPPRRHRRPRRLADFAGLCRRRQVLKALADYVHGKGLEFGLWFEPEMVNPDSDMFRNHPDWVLKPTAGRLPMQGRTQQVVDLTNPDAYDYIYGAMDKLVGELGIDYIKWDHNKLVTEEVSPLTGRPAAHAQTLAVYRIFTDLRPRTPVWKSKAAPPAAAVSIWAFFRSPTACGRPIASTRWNAPTSSATRRCWCRRK